METASVIVECLLEDDDFDLKDFALKYHDYHPIHLLTTREVRQWFLNELGMPVRSVYRQKDGSIHGYASDRGQLLRSSKTLYDDESDIQRMLDRWTETTVKGGLRIISSVQYYEHEGLSEVHFSLDRDDTLRARRDWFDKQQREQEEKERQKYYRLHMGIERRG